MTKQYKDPERERRRLETIRKRKGEGWLKENAIKAGKLTPTKFNPTTASEAAKKRWAKHRAEARRKAQQNEQQRSNG